MKKFQFIAIVLVSLFSFVACLDDATDDKQPLFKVNSSGSLSYTQPLSVLTYNLDSTLSSNVAIRVVSLTDKSNDTTFASTYSKGRITTNASLKTYSKLKAEVDNKGVYAYTTIGYRVYVITTSATYRAGDIKLVN